MEIVKRTEEEAARIEADKVTTHAVVVLSFPAIDTEEAETQLVEAMKLINARALAAGMVVLSTSISSVAWVPESGRGWVTVVIMCQWMSRDEMARMQRQQMLTGK